MCIVAYITFKEVKVEAQSLLKENKHSLRRNFPNVVYKHLRLLSLLALPESPALAFPEQWMGWRDLLGPDYFSNPIRKSPVDNNTKDEPIIILGVEEKTSFDTDWNKMFIRLQEYYHENGTLVITNGDRELQAWVNTQRSHKKRGLFRKDRETCLNKLLFDWIPQQNDWDASFKLVTAFKELHGHADIPNRYRPNYRLGQWAREQRHSYHQDTLMKHRIRKLESIGFRWSIPESERCLTLEQRSNNNGEK
jgi:hypothetical protein